MATRWMPDPRISQGATGALAWLTTPAMARTEPMHSYKTATAQPSVAHEATGLSTAAGNGASCHYPVLLKQRNRVSDSPGMAFGGVELMSELNKIALSLASSSESRAFSLHGGSATAQKLRHQRESSLWEPRRTKRRMESAFSW